MLKFETYSFQTYFIQVIFHKNKLFISIVSIISSHLTQYIMESLILAQDERWAAAAACLTHASRTQID